MSKHIYTNRSPVSKKKPRKSHLRIMPPKKVLPAPTKVIPAPKVGRVVMPKTKVDPKHAKKDMTLWNISTMDLLTDTLAGNSPPMVTITEPMDDDTSDNELPTFAELMSESKRWLQGECTNLDITFKMNDTKGTLSEFILDSYTESSK